MRIAAEGCALRSLTEGDVPAIAFGCADPEIARWLPHLPQPYGTGDARTFVAQAIDSCALGREQTLAIVDDEDTLLGVVNVRFTDEPPTVGYWVASSARGRGVATAATRAITGWAFAEFGPPRIALHAEPANRASCRVAEKCGFRRLPHTIRGLEDRELVVFELARPDTQRPPQEVPRRALRLRLDDGRPDL